MSCHTVLMPLRWSDLDAYDHVNNVRFLSLFEDARVRMITENPIGDIGPGRGTGLLVARIEADYLTPLPYRAAPVAVDTWTEEIGGSSFRLGCQLRDPLAAEAASYTISDLPESSRTYARAQITMVAIDLATGRPRPLIASERTALNAWSV